MLGISIFLKMAWLPPLRIWKRKVCERQEQWHPGTQTPSLFEMVVLSPVPSTNQTA